jgi:hypothetical protein
MATYPWYEIVETDALDQGDIFYNCPVLIPEWDTESWEIEAKYQLKGTIEYFDVIVLSQSCDLENEKIETALVCPIWPVETFIKTAFPKNSEKEYPRLREGIRRGYQPDLHMLAACELAGWEQPIQIVSFHQIYTVPIAMLRHMCITLKQRLQLVPPY